MTLREYVCKCLEGIHVDLGIKISVTVVMNALADAGCPHADNWTIGVWTSRADWDSDSEGVEYLKVSNPRLLLEMRWPVENNPTGRFHGQIGRLPSTKYRNLTPTEDDIKGWVSIAMTSLNDLPPDLRLPVTFPILPQSE